MSQTFWKAINEKYALKIEYDTHPDSPFRLGDERAHMITWHRNYSIGDRHNYADANDFFRSLLSEFGYSDVYYDNLQSKEQLMKALNKHCVILPIYGYEHGGMTISTGSFSCPWDSGQLGWIYATHKQIRDWRGIKRVSQKIREREAEIMESMVKTYDQYLQGEVFGYTLYSVDRESLDQHLEQNKLSLNDLDWDELENAFLLDTDSCWGFYGDDHENNGMKDYLPFDSHDLLGNLQEGTITQHTVYRYA